MYYLKSKGSPYSVAERRVPELIPVLGSQPAADVSHHTVHKHIYEEWGRVAMAHLNSQCPRPPIFIRHCCCLLVVAGSGVGQFPAAAHVVCRQQLAHGRCPVLRRRRRRNHLEHLGVRDLPRPLSNVLQALSQPLPG